MLWLQRRPEWLILVIALLPLANIYIGGIALFLSLLAMTTIGGAQNTDFRVARWFFVVWGSWATLAALSFSQGGITWRQLFQAIEFAFYGVVAWQAAVAFRTDSGLFVRILAACIVSAVLLAVCCLLAAATFGADWPPRLLGRNESAFYIAIMGVAPAIYLLARPTWLVQTPNMVPALGLAIALFMPALFALEARAGLAVALLLFGLLALYRLCGRRPVLATAAGGIAGTGALAAIILSGGGLALGDPSTSFSNLERLSLLQASWRLFTESPWLGWGWGSIDQLIPTVSETVLSYPHPHNSLAHFAVELGIGGAILYLLIIARPAIRAFTLASTGFRSEALFCLACSVALMLLGMVGVSFYGASRALPVAILLAAVEALPLRNYVVVPTPLSIYCRSTEDEAEVGAIA